MSEMKVQIEQIKSIDTEELSSFTILYAPLLKPLSSQYYLLMSGIYESHGKIKNHRFFCEALHCTPMELSAAREELEEMMLIKTFVNEETNSMIIQLLPIKRGYKFLNHEVLGRLYMMKMGTKAYLFAQQCFKDQELSLEGYKNISKPFDAQIMSQWAKGQEEDFQKNRLSAATKKGSFDLNGFLRKCSFLVFPKELRTKENLSVIEEMGNYYKVSIEDMILFVGKAIPHKDPKLNVNRFKEMIRNKYLPLQKENTDIYQMNPVAFLMNKQQGIMPSNADARLLENLSSQFKLKDEVINVLIEYILANNENRLNRSYVEKIAGVWVRNQIDSKEKALLEIEPKKERKQTKKKRTLPDWYMAEEEEFETASEDELLEVRRMIEEMKK